MHVTRCNNPNKSENRFILLNNKINKSVNLWSSINYTIITDKEVINGIDHPQIKLDEPIMIELILKTINKGDTREDSIEIVFNEPKPYIHTNGTASGGETHGYLDKNEEYEYYFTYRHFEEAESGRQPCTG
ncbi:hypothetical protein [Paenibacillus sedimenti]|uniref:Uncharacterized protein n=1 Tax=Paenibacillus sedimenti TaxID=2770274 RepID=A0A926KR95_9BACL|nr:hypothetical protein [Paenibacillus sedimenti]MBD0381456.1 hypothetical protein [Paenibacillus sedimenti]